MVVKRWLRAALMADTTLATLAPGRVWEYVAPPGTVTPFVVWTPVAGTDVNSGIGAVRYMTDFLYQVTAWMTGNDFGVLDPIVARIDQLLQGASGASSGGYVLGCRREGIIDLPPNVGSDGRTTRQAGGEYRL